MYDTIERNATTENATGATNITEDFIRFDKPDWIVPAAINIFLAILTILVLSSLMHYGVKTKKWRQNPSSNKEKLNAGVVYVFLIICGFMCMFRYIANQVYMNVGFTQNENELCESVADTAFISYCLILWSVCMFLWCRQRAFYTNKMLSFNAPKLVRVLSFVSVILTNTTGFGYVLLFTIPVNYRSSENVGCVFNPDNTLLVTYGIYPVMLITLTQLILLYLFLYPLIKMNSFSFKSRWWGKPIKPTHQQNISSERDRSDSASTSANNSMKRVSNLHRSKSLSEKPSGYGIKLILKKTLLFAVLSTLFDVLLQIISSLVLSQQGHRRFSGVLFDIGAFFNLIFLVLSFATYKAMLTSFCTRHRQN